MTEERGVVRRIAWGEIFPWLILLRTFRVAIAPTVLLAAVLGTFLQPWGRSLGALLFLSADEQQTMREVPGAGLPLPPPPGGALDTQVPAAIDSYLPHVPSGLQEAYFYLVEPAWRLFHLQLPFNQAAYYLFVNMWMLAVWAFFGAVIVRRAVVQLGAEQTTGLRETVLFAARRYLQYFLAPLFPLLGVLAIVVLLIPLGLLMRLDVGVVIAGVVWLLVILLGLVAVWLLGGLLLGWPLMWGAISAEREGDAFEAFSRSYAYVYGRPLHYLFYVVVAALFGTLCWAVVNYAAQMVVEFGFWGASWGSGGQRMADIREMTMRSPWYVFSGDRSFTALDSGTALISLNLMIVRLVVSAFNFSFFWVAAAAIYLLLRLDVDQKELDEVYQPDDEFRFAAGRRALAETPLPAAEVPDASPPDTAE